MTYILYGALGSPYSQKIRALLRYRRLPYQWVDEGARRQAALAAVKAPVIPVLEYPDGTFANDSTPLVYDLEARHGERGVVPPDPAQAFIAHLLEDFADEWLTKAMFGYRWLEEVDQVQMSRWLAFDSAKGGGLEQSQQFAQMFRARQVGRMALVGCTRENFPLIEASTRAVLDALEPQATACLHPLTLARLGVGRAILAGNSLGGEIAWQVALADPARVAGLVLVDAAGLSGLVEA